MVDISYIYPQQMYTFLVDKTNLLVLFLKIFSMFLTQIPIVMICDYKKKTRPFGRAL